MNIDDKLAIARKMYSGLIIQKNNEIKDLEAKIKFLNEIESEIKIQVPEDKTPLPGLGITDSLRYTKMGLTEAANDALVQLVRNHVKGTTKSEVAKYMIENGFKPNGKNYLISVDTALRRAVDSGRITSTLKDGRRIYQLKVMD